MAKRAKRNLAIILSAIVFMSSVSAPTPPNKLVAQDSSAITSISGSMSPPWAAHESGILPSMVFVEVIATPSGLQAPTPCGREDFVYRAGGTTAGAAEGWRRRQDYRHTGRHFSAQMVVRPEIDKPGNCAAKGRHQPFRHPLHTGARLA
jgi:hypothetical protein